MLDNPGTVELPPAFKIVICGPTGVGKTCLIYRYVHETFVIDTKSTIGVDFSLKHVVLDREIAGRENLARRKAVLQLWDFAGEDRFRKILPVYAQGAQGVLLCFDLANRTTLEDLAEWHAVITAHLNPEVPLILLGLKNDLPLEASPEAIQRFKTRHDLWAYCAASALTGKGVEAAFNLLIRLIAAMRWGLNTPSRSAAAPCQGC